MFFQLQMIFWENGNAVADTINEGALKETSDFMFKLLMAIGIIVMFLVGTVIGIQFMVASAEDKAKVKEALIPYVVGCCVIFGSFSIWRIAVNLGQSITSSGPVTDGGTTDWEVPVVPDSPYRTVTQIKQWCYLCNEEKTNQDEIDSQICSTCGHTIEERTITEKFCNNCDEPWVDGHTC